MVALTESAPPPRKSRAQRRREQREASRAPSGSVDGAALEPASPPSQSESNSPCLPPRLRASAVNTSSSSGPLDALIADYLNDAYALPELAARHNLSIPELCDILDSPEFNALLERLTRLAEKRARDIATHTRAGALSTLETVCATATSPETARKAATALIRASDRVLYPPRSRAANPTAPGGAGVGAADHPCASESDTPLDHASQSTSVPPPNPTAEPQAAQPCHPLIPHAFPRMPSA